MALAPNKVPELEERAGLNTWQRVLIYLGILAVGVTLSIYIDDHYHVGGDRAIGLALGPVFVLAATGWPWWLYGTIRRVRWFGLIKSDTVMRLALLVIGGFLVVMGLGLF